MDFIHQGQAFGSVAAAMLSTNFDTGVLRPFIGANNRHYVTVNEGNSKPRSVLSANANATLRKEEWKILDDAVAMAARQRVQFIRDLQAAGLVRNLANGFGKTVLESQRMGDITGATISMDPARKSEGDRPEFDIINLPLPIIHKDFFFTARQIAVSRNNGQGIDTTTAELAARKVIEEAERLALGLAGTYSYGGGTVYGVTNFPGRLTAELTEPGSTGWTPHTTVTEVLGMIQQSVDNLMFGPWALYMSPGWSVFLDDDYKDESDITLRTRLAQVAGLSAVRTLDYLTGYQIILIQMTSDVIQLINGMNVTTLQWNTNGGMEVHYKVMAMMVPHLRTDLDSNSGIIHGSVV